jgi:Derlin-2/3
MIFSWEISFLTTIIIYFLVCVLVGGGTADYAFCMLLGVGMMLASYPLLLGWFSLPPVFCQNLIYYVLYIWSKRNPTAQANIWGFPMQAIYLPFAYLILTVFMGNPYLPMLHGMAIGHIYYFLVDVIPTVYGKDFVQTPRFLIDFFGVGQYQPEVAPVRGGMGATNQNEANARGGGGGGHTWGGGGQRLGTN